MLRFALDLGTTTLEGSLVDHESGEVLARGERANPQSVYGADVITRLTLAVRSLETASKMRSAVLDCAADLLRSLCADAGAPDREVESGVLVGNTVMHHLALGLDVSTLATAPYRPVAVDATIADFGRSAGLPPMYVAPLIASYVGSDAIAAALATGLTDGPTRLLIDLGTNTEVLLWHGGTLYVTSAPAGPAFEGGEISCGMRARPGAICSVVHAGDGFQVTTIGDAAPEGICGSGLIDAVAALLKAGMMDPTGRLWPDCLPAVSLAPGVTLTQKDVRAFQLAKGAALAAVRALMREAGITATDLEEVLLAGAFGTAVRAASVLSTGMLPQVEPKKVRAVGNAALVGAELMAASNRARPAAERLARSARHVELSLDPHFQDEFIESLNFHMAMPQGTR